MTKTAPASSAGFGSASTVSNQQRPALRHATVVSVEKPVGGSRNAAVFNLEVDDEHEYFANGILVSNCAMARYAVMSRPTPSKTPDEVEPEDPRAAMMWRARRRLEKPQGHLDRSRYVNL